MKRRIHDVVCKTLLGDSCSSVNWAIDYPVRFLGAGHRRIFHSIPEVIILGCMFDKNKLRGTCAGLLHLLLDFGVGKGEKVIWK